MTGPGIQERVYHGSSCLPYQSMHVLEHIGPSTNFTFITAHFHTFASSNHRKVHMGVSAGRSTWIGVISVRRVRASAWLASRQPSHLLSNVNLPSQLHLSPSVASKSWFSHPDSRYVQPSQALQRFRSRCFRRAFNRRWAIRAAASPWSTRLSYKSSSAATD
jgi:hypothetical protein